MSLHFTPKVDIVATANITHHIQSPKRKKNTSCKIANNFFVKSGKLVVNKHSNIHYTVNNLHIFKKGCKVASVENKSGGLDIEDIRKFFIANCHDTLPVNIVTNSIHLASILKFVFSSSMRADDWIIKPPECSENKKSSPKVKIWSLRHNKKKPIDELDMQDFIETFNTCKRNKALRYTKQHVYIPKNQIINSKYKRMKASSSSNPCAFLTSTYDERGNVDLMIGLTLGVDKKTNNKIASEMAHIKDLWNLYC